MIQVVSLYDCYTLFSIMSMRFVSGVWLSPTAESDSVWVWTYISGSPFPYLKLFFGLLLSIVNFNCITCIYFHFIQHTCTMFTIFILLSTLTTKPYYMYIRNKKHHEFKRTPDSEILGSSTDVGNFVMPHLLRHRISVEEVASFSRLVGQTRKQGCFNPF